MVFFLCNLGHYWLLHDHINIPLRESLRHYYSLSDFRFVILRRFGAWFVYLLFEVFEGDADGGQGVVAGAFGRFEDGDVLLSCYFL